MFEDLVYVARYVETYKLYVIIVKKVHSIKQLPHTYTGQGKTW